MEISRQLIVIWGVLVVLWNPVARATQTPEPTPTPRPGSLAALAGSTSLNLDVGNQDAGPTTITNADLSTLADTAVITVMTDTAAEFDQVEVSRRADPKTRDKWRKRVTAQKKRIATLEAKKAAVEEEINRLERGSLNARALDRIEQAEVKLRAIEKEIFAAERALSRIVHEARKEGAKPGWFR